MIVSWILYALLVSALLGVGAHALDGVCRLFRLPVRFVWLGALLAALGLAALAPLRAVPAAGPAPVSATGLALPVASAAGVGEAAEWPDAAARLLGALGSAVEWPLRAAAPLAAGRAGGALGLLWLALSLGLVALGAATQLRYRASRRRWPQGEIAGARVRVAPAAGPAVLGLIRPEIVVPAWLLGASRREQRLVLLHEGEHLRARDPLTLAAGCLAVATMPWNPVLWWMLLRLRLAVELDCDARVLRRGVRPQAYGSMLIDVAGRGSGLSLGVPALAGSPSTLERRLLAMSSRFTRLSALRAGAVGVLGAAALLAACEARMPTATEIEAMDAAAAASQVQRMRFVTPGSEGATYYLDGVPVSAEEAQAVPAERIAQVEVVRSRGAEGESAQIRLTTRSADEAAGPTRVLVNGEEARGFAQSRMSLTRPADGAGKEEHREMVVVGPRAEGAAADGAPVLTRVVTGAGDEFDGLLFIDGVRAQPSEMRALRPERIERVEVIKGDAAVRVYGAEAAGGVIRITTKAEGR